MEIVHTLLKYPLYFILLISILVFVHEFGHYYIARLCGVRIEVFSIGFGRELFGWNDRHGTRWKFSMLPLGGYVKMFGDADPASRPSAEVEEMMEDDRKVAFYHQTLPKRAAVVIAGPAANYIFAILVMAIVFMTAGQPFTLPVASTIVEDSPAAQAGMEPGDRITSINGTRIERFEELQQYVFLRPGEVADLTIDRKGEVLNKQATLQNVELTDRFGAKHRIGRLGIQSKESQLQKHNVIDAIAEAGKETWRITTSTLMAMGQIIKGDRSTEDLGGPLRIAQMAGDTADLGIVPWIMLMVMISINLGLVNLFPIPVLDGGHLMFYFFEAILGKPLSLRAQEIGMRVGLTAVMALMVLALFNDFSQLKVFDFGRNLITRIIS